jgi:hypothetical protein
LKVRKIRLEKVTGIVALSYLVLIPLGAYYAWQKIQLIDRDVTTVWNKLDLPEPKHTPIINVKGLFGGSE